MNTTTAIHLFNVLISKLNYLLDKQYKTYYAQPITPEININYITGTNNGLLLAIDEMEAIVKALCDQDIYFKERDGNMKIIEGEYEYLLPNVLDRNFKFK